MTAIPGTAMVTEVTRLSERALLGEEVKSHPIKLVHSA
jgi:hypothetical protein